jgi:Tfp pilus assembly protein FimT
MSRPGKAAGYTLTELVLVTAAVAILAATAVPVFERVRQEAALRGATALVAQSLAWGRMHALATNGEMAFDLDPAANRLCWAEPGTGTCYEGTIRHVDPQIRFAGYPARSVRFHPRGNAAPAGSFTLQGPSGSYRVIVAPGGRIRIERP